VANDLLSAFLLRRFLYCEMNMGEDARLLREYVESGSNRAFSALVDRHFGLVYTAALRIADGDAHLAQDVVQSVFTDFAGKAKSFPRDLFLGGWLYKHTCFIAANAVRKERRRRIRERQAFEMNSANEPSDPIWSRVSPVLDEAMSRLGASDRNALVLRFFERKSFRAVGGVLGISEEAARKRVDRALDKLRGYFARRGLSFSAVVLSSALDSHAAAAAPMGLSSLVATTALSEAAKGGGAGFSLMKIITITRLMSITKKIAVSAAAVATTAAIIIQSQDNSRLQRENRELGEQTAVLSDKLRTENERPPVESRLVQAQFQELMRLRGEVGVLKDQLARAKKVQIAKVDGPQIESPSESASEDPVEGRTESAFEWLQGLSSELASEDPVEERRKIEAAKIKFTKQFMLAFAEGGDTNDLATDQYYNQFQVVYRGAYNEITDPSQTIVLQENAPMQAGDGGWLKVYGFADGSALIHEEPDGHFEAWESQHTQRPAGQ
jgi:RNA polymerase sigma factor (sigma-70 family)